MAKPKRTLEDFFDEQGFNTHPFKQDEIDCMELEDWTNGGVDMIITLVPFTKDEFISWVDSFDVDEQIDLYRQDPKYRANFSILESLKDFMAFKTMLRYLVKTLSLQKNKDL